MAIVSCTTWLTYIVSLLQAGPSCYQEVNKTVLEEHVKYLELKLPESEKSEIECLQDIAPPRVAKTHLPFNLASQWVTRDKVKTVVALRNPKDTLVSLYHFYKMLTGKSPSL